MMRSLNDHRSSERKRLAPSKPNGLQTEVRTRTRACRRGKEEGPKARSAGRSVLGGPGTRPGAGVTQGAESKTWKILPAAVDVLNVFKSLTAY